MDAISDFIQQKLVADTGAGGVATIVAPFTGGAPRIYYRNPQIPQAASADPSTGVEIPMWPEVTHWCPDSTPTVRGTPMDETYQLDLWGDVPSKLGLLEGRVLALLNDQPMTIAGARIDRAIFLTTVQMWDTALRIHHRAMQMRVLGWRQ